MGVNVNTGVKVDSGADADADGGQHLLALRFEEHRSHLRAVAYRMLGSIGEAEDAVQEAWLRLSRSDVSDVENLGGWLTTVVARLCLNGLRARETRREDSLDDRLDRTGGAGAAPRMPDPVLAREGGVIDPEQEVLLADSVGLALLVVLESLAPAERLAFVLHDMFSVPFDEIALMLDKTTTATRQLASRARRRVQGQAPAPDPDLARQREAVSAFFAATRDGDFDALLALLHPDVVLRSDGGTVRAGQSVVLTGARTVGSQAALYSALAPFVRPVLVNGAAGVLCVVEGRLMSVMAFTVTGGRITAIDVLTDPDRLDAIDLGPLT
ncbi:sigma-70 family RNA polymerase sigma factor [Streptomyces sp. AP-93]|uniref:sigma-70 family RNA polymerase sigma factor n=1 Tax=Streptomyces sp. AP-93 TaxID=2929048 RepID=UPI001FAEE953|nr:sigma-70 family RNA polymerase sigma factor [Streptomyces sp. AP-93]MCJ0875527.1 sigma-70 family RNA polymerase sigma factor [Streptomyces sp. AP-93]